jgi:hypothetical protein
MSYNLCCLDEQNTGALLFQKLPGSANLIFVGKAPSTCGHSSSAVRLGNGSARGGRFVMATLADKFWAHVDRRENDGCWEWQGVINRGGYGVFALGTWHKRTTAHRFSWILANGNIPDGLFVLHNCDNRKCCNPSHLRLGTHLDNMRDKAVRGHVSGERNPRAKLTWKQVREIRSRYVPNQISYRKLAKEYGVHMSVIKDIVKKIIWREQL